jgi:hypothetical protein
MRIKLKKLPPNLVWACAFVLAMCFSFGCSCKHSKSVTKQAEIKAFDQEEEKLFAPYLTGNVEQARQSLKQTIQHLEESNSLDLHSQSGRLYGEYIRLYALEKRTGHETDAAVALIKARYWWIRNMESRELSKGETIESRKLSDDENVKYFISVTPEQIMKWVDNLNAGENGNKPKYLQYITTAPSEENTNSPGKVP